MRSAITILIFLFNFNTLALDFEVTFVYDRNEIPKECYVFRKAERKLLGSHIRPETERIHIEDELKKYPIKKVEMMLIENIKSKKGKITFHVEELYCGWRNKKIDELKKEISAFTFKFDINKKPEKCTYLKKMLGDDFKFAKAVFLDEKNHKIKYNNSSDQAFNLKYSIYRAKGNFVRITYTKFENTLEFDLYKCEEEFKF